MECTLPAPETPGRNGIEHRKQVQPCSKRFKKQRVRAGRAVNSRGGIDARVTGIRPMRNLAGGGRVRRCRKSKVDRRMRRDFARTRPPGRSRERTSTEETRRIRNHKKKIFRRSRSKGAIDAKNRIRRPMPIRNRLPFHPGTQYTDFHCGQMWGSASRNRSTP